MLNDKLPGIRRITNFAPALIINSIKIVLEPYTPVERRPEFPTGSDVTISFDVTSDSTWGAF